MATKIAPEMDIVQSTDLNHIKHTTDNEKFLSKYPENVEVTLTRLRIGHHTQISHSFLMAREEPSICTSRGVQATAVNHIPAECQINHNI